MFTKFIQYRMLFKLLSNKKIIVISDNAQKIIVIADNAQTVLCLNIKIGKSGL